MDKFELRRQKLIVIRDQLCGGKAAELARRIGKEPSYVSRMLYPSGKEGKKRIAEGMANDIETAFGLKPGWMSSSDGIELLEIIRPDADDRLDIPRLSAVGSMGNGDLLTYDGDQIVDFMPISKTWIARNVNAPIDALRIITGHGNSMEPTFRDGDLLLVDTSKTTVNVDGVYVLSAHGRLFIKSVRQRLSGEYEISSDNPTFKTIDVLNGSAEVTVHGRVVYKWNGCSL